MTDIQVGRRHLAFISLCAVLCMMGSRSVVHAADRPNVVLMVVDDLGYGDLGCYGSTVHRTPHIDRLAAEGVRLTDFHTNGPVCSPTRAALLTGRYQQRTGIESAIGFTRDIGMPLSEQTIAERLARAGYKSGVFGKWHVGHVGDFGPNLQGFEESWCSNNSPDYHTHISRVGELDWYHNHQPCHEPGYLTDLVTRHTCEFIQEHRDQPFFAFVSHVAVHFPFQGPGDPPHRTAGKIWHGTKYGPLPKGEYKRAYRDMLEAVDRSVGEVIATLDRLGLRRNTLVFVTSDNGAYSWVGSNGPYRGQKGDLFEGGHRVAAVANWPGRIRPGTVSDQTAMTMDILPTLLAVTGVDASEDHPLDGIDLSPMLFEEQALEPRTLCWRFDNSYTQIHTHAVRQGNLKYVVQKGKRYLFDLGEDPSEQDNLIERHAAEAQRLEAAYQQWLGQVSAKKGATAVSKRRPRGSSAPHPVRNPDSRLMLDLPAVGTDPSRIDFAALPRVPSEHVVVSDVRERNGVNQHNYLAYHDGRFRVMWSDGPGREDQVGQRVKFATSRDGLNWSRPEFLTPVPPGSGPDSPHYGTRTLEGFRWISRGFWQRGAELYALASLDEAAGFFGPSLELHAFRLRSDGASWEDAGVLADDTINNFPPKKLPSGEWMMSRRPHNYKETGVHFLVGGVKAIDDWRSFPVLGSSSELAAEEPLWWVLPDGNMMALFRDNRGSKRIYRSFSTDDGRTWSRPIRTNFPDATSKMHGLRLRDGRYVLASNANPKRRDPLTLALSGDGMVFTKLGYLVGGRHVDYPYVMEHGQHLYVAFAGAKQSVEVLRVRITDLGNLGKVNVSAAGFSDCVVAGAASGGAAQ